MAEPCAAPSPGSRYMPTLRMPVSGSRVMTCGRVMNGPPSWGQVVSTGIEPRSGSRSTISCTGPEETCFGGSEASLPELRDHLELVPEPLRRRHLEERPELAGRLLEVLAGERPGGAAPGAEEVHGHRHARRRRASRRGAPGRLCLAARSASAAMSSIEVDGLADADELAGPLQSIEEIAQGPVGHGKAGSTPFRPLFQRSLKDMSAPMPQTIRVAHSPDSDDAFMFYGLFTGAVRADGLAFVQRDRRHRVAQPGGAGGDLRHHRHLRRRLRPSSRPVRAARRRSLLRRRLRPHRDREPRPPGSSGSRSSGRPASPSRASGPAPTWRSACASRASTPMFVDFKDVGRMVKLGKAEAGLVIHEGQLTARGGRVPRGRGPGGELEGAHRAAAAARA